VRRLILGLIVSFPLASVAQEAAPQLQEDPRAARFREVERGFFVGFEAGYLGFAKTLTRTPNAFPSAGAEGGFASGFVTGVNVGYDLTPQLALSAFVLGGNAKANPSYGAFDVVATGGDLRFGVPAASDANGVKRLYLYVHGRVGYLWSHPVGLFANTDVLIGAGIGAEYFTRLRHFSIGLAVDGDYLKDVKVFGFAITPTLRYTF
jgi:hypothetical protein